jgi:hypothetical protein
MEAMRLADRLRCAAAHPWDRDPRVFAYAFDELRGVMLDVADVVDLQLELAEG